jgi:hypothetical protein
VKLDCVILGVKFCATGLYKFGRGKFCGTGLYSFGACKICGPGL